MPLVVTESTAEWAQGVLADDPVVLVWWAAEVECVSAISRNERAKDQTPEATLAALERLDRLAAKWHEIAPSVAARRVARRLLRVHPLRAADALQLAAAIVAAEGDPASLEVVSLDRRIVDAARREGFAVLDGPDAAES